MNHEIFYSYLFKKVLNSDIEVAQVSQVLNHYYLDMNVLLSR